MVSRKEARKPMVKELKTNENLSTSIREYISSRVELLVGRLNVFIITC